MAKERSEIKQDILRRVYWLYVIFIMLGIAIVTRIIYIQYGPKGAYYRDKSEEITFARVAIPSERGDILALDGRLLATSVPMFEIRMDLGAEGLVDSMFNKNVDSLSFCLSSFFKDRSKDVYKRMLMGARENKKGNRFKLISPHRVNYIEMKQISSFPLFRLGRNKGGLLTTQINQRELPNGSLARRTIGMVNQTGTKLGIEGAFDHYLRGTDGNTLTEKISGSFRIPVSNDRNVEPINGLDVLTTLNIDIQDVAEKELKRQLDIGQADWGSVVLMEVSTGRICAMSNLTRKAAGVFAEDYNYALGMNLEPGSTFKLASLITLLEEGGMSLDHVIDTENGTAIVGKGRTKVIDSHKYGELTLRQIFEVSSNVGFAKAVNEIYASHPERFVDNICRMGLDKSLDMQIAGGATPIVKHPDGKGWDAMTLTMMSYGYALRLTPMHTLAFYNAIANKGRMVRPMLVQEIREYGQTIRTFPSQTIVEKVCSDKTLDLVRKSLEGVVEDGTAKVLKNPYYKVAGKTGTAQIAQGRRGYTDAHGGRHYLATLVGYFPADNPKYSCIVVMKTYNGGNSNRTYYGASLAGPVFRALADRVYASGTSWNKADKNEIREPSTIPAPIKAGRIEEIRKVSDRLSIPLSGEHKNKGWGFVQQDTTSGSAHVTTTAQNIKLIPDVCGMGLKEAIFLLEVRGLVVSFSGRGTVVSQSIVAGTAVVKGVVIEIKLDI